MFTDRMMTRTHTHEVLFLIVAGLHTHTAVTEVYQKIMLNLDDVVFRQNIKASNLSHTSKLLYSQDSFEINIWFSQLLLSFL